MPAYNHNDLYNKYVQEQADESFNQAAISEKTYKAIVNTFPHKLYTPNYFIRIALGLLSFVAVLFSGVLLGLIIESHGDAGFTALLIFLALFYYGALEFFIHKKQYYNSGIDNVLMVAVIICLVSAFLLNEFENQYTWLSFLLMIVCFWFSIRFTDAFMAILFYLALITFTFLLYLKLGEIAKATMPFLLMILSAVIYVIIQRLSNKRSLVFYRFCIQCVILLTLCSFYASVNYFVVDAGNRALNPQLSSGTHLPLGWLFWVFTLLIPVAYIFYGVRKKNIMFLRTGILAAIAAILTVLYYYPVLPAEIVMTLTGLCAIIISYVLLKYLKTPKHHFTAERNSYLRKELGYAQAIITAQIAGKRAAGNSFDFGGGSSGGAGASGQW